MKKIIIIICVFYSMLWTFGQQVSNVKNSWLGNSSPDPDKFMPQGIEGMYVSSDGTVYTNIGWEEGGGTFTQVKNEEVSHAPYTFGWGGYGGREVGSNSSYIYFSGLMGNEGGNLVDPERWPVAGKNWTILWRRNKNDITTGPTFPGSKGYDPIFKNYLVVKETPENAKVEITGIYASEAEVFVAIAADNIIKVYDANTMAFKREWSVAKPYQIAMDSYGKLWVAEDINCTKIKRYDSNGNMLPQAINLELGSFIGDFCIDNTDRILIGDRGQREQVLIYSNINTSPSFTSTFGALNGIYSGTSGKNEPLKFHQIRGIGTDNNGNIYVCSTQGNTSGPGTILESYKLATGALNWSKYCVMFVDAMGIDDATDGQDIYGMVEHFTVDYTKPEGQEAKYVGYTVNAYKYPHDPRLNSGEASGALGAVAVRNIKGQKFLIMSNMMGALNAIFRFNPATDGEVAILCVYFSYGVKSKFPGSMDGAWMWRDLNANGQVEASEIVSTKGSGQPDGGYGFMMDVNGTIWGAVGSGITQMNCLGLDANNIPLYDGSFTVIPKPAPLENIKRVQYDAVLDRMYLGGSTANYPLINWWGSIGRTVQRYDNWSTGNRTAHSELLIPFEGNSATMSYFATSEYVFTTIDAGTPSGSIVNGQINIFNTLDNSSVGYIRPPWSGIGWMDMNQSFSAYKRKNGEFVIVQEDDGRNKNILYRWCPSGNCTETTNTLATNTNYLGYTAASAAKTISINSNISWSITGLPTWLSASVNNGAGNANVTFTATTLTGTSNRSATITLSGGSLSKEITVFQGFSDTQVPAMITGLTSEGITPFSFFLKWNPSTDNVGVVAYEILKNGVPVLTTAGINHALTNLSPNTAYNISIRAIDAAGNKSPVASITETTSVLSYPYITASSDNPQYSEGKEKAFDGDNNTSWSIFGSSAWLQIQYEFASVRNQCTIVSVDRLPERNPKDFVFYASNDGVDWTTLNAFTNQLWTAPSQAKTFYFANNIAYKYFRLSISQNMGSNMTWVAEVAYSNGTIIDNEASSVPTGLTASYITQTSLTFDWTASTDNVGGLSYEVFKNGVSIGTTNSTSMSTTGLTCNTAYAMTVKARDAAGNWSLASTTLNLTTSSCPEIIAPSIPSNINSSLITQISFTLTWTASTDNVGVTGYEVFKDGVSVGTTTSTNMSITGLTCATTYAMTVKARDAAGNWSDASAAINATTLACANTDMNIVNENEKISIYPIPATDVLNFENLPSEKIIYEIFSMEGKDVQAGIIMGSSIAINDLINGMYFIKIISDGKNGTLRFCKQ